MKTIFKYKLTLENFQKIEIHKGAEILKVDLQKNIICIWAVVDTKKEKEQRVFILLDSGQELPTERKNLHYLNSCFTRKVDLTKHIFELLYKGV